jgi:AcrR family transcriptional regulator
MTSYQSLALEKIAEEAGTGKTTIYRWWRSKGELVGEALAWHLQPDGAVETSSIEDDLRTTIQQTVRNYSGNLAGVVVPAVAADMAHDPDLHKTFLARFLAPRRAVARRPLDRAIEAGLLPEDLDVELIMDLWAGAIFYRTLMSDSPLNDDFPQQFVDLILHGRLPTVAKE